MIRVEVKPRQDDLFDIYVGDEGDHFVNSNQGYANVEDAEAIVRRMWPAVDPTSFVPNNPNAVVLRVTYRNGKTKTEQLR